MQGVDARALPISGSETDFKPLLELIGDASCVLLGEATHGTDEFYRERARITQQLIENKGFTAVALEADWPDAWRLNRFVRGESGDRSATEALGIFSRFPDWMWRNSPVRDFLDWLAGHNRNCRRAEQVGIYGLDLYSLHASIEAVLAYLDRVDPDAAARARNRYGCFESFGQDVQDYAFSAGLGLTESCERQAVSQLVELHRAADEYARRNGPGGEDEAFFAEQNARLVMNAEEYYRAMFRSHVLCWNLRDRHMADTLEALARHLGNAKAPTKIVVWAHNSHVGDARATEVRERGEMSLGQMIREKLGRAAVLVGFTTYSGWVTAASQWDGAAERKPVRPALEGSYEALFHATGKPAFLLPLRHAPSDLDYLRESRLERAIGVVYRPATERMSHYFTARIPEQFDAILHYDTTHAVQRLEHPAQAPAGEPAETYPSGL